MELHPYLEYGCIPKREMWYVLPSDGASSLGRVGSSIIYCKNNKSVDYIYCIGGASPDGPFADIRRIDLRTFQCETLTNKGLVGRYEHAIFSPSSFSGKIYIFGGASQKDNFNDIQVYDTEDDSWCNVSPSGLPPSCRTYHTSSACQGDNFYVIFGGNYGHTAIDDPKLHCFNAKSCEWTNHQLSGEGPNHRQGHVIAVINDILFLHGGMSDMKFYNDFYSLNLDTYCWDCIELRGVYPSGRAAHGSVVHKSNLYVYGGMNCEGALDDFYQFDILSYEWTKIISLGPSPGNRLDFGVCSFSYSTHLNHTHINKTTDELKTSNCNDIEQSSTETPDKESCFVDVTSMLGVTQHEKQSSDIPAVENRTSDLSQKNNDTENICHVDSLSISSNSKENSLVHHFAILGGMDTEGVIFDDIFSTLLN